LLILALDAIFAGSENQVTAYIEYSGADIFVSQEGVRNMHMALSSLPASVVGKVRAVKGVESATGIHYLTNMVKVGSENNIAYVIGLPSDASTGVPWRVVEGKTIPASDEAIIDRGIAAKAGVGIGNKVKIMGEEFKIAGLTEGTASIVNSVAFISKKDWTRLRGNGDTVSYVLVKVQAGESPDVVARRIERQIDKVTAQSREMFSHNERQVVKDMSTDILAIMNLVGFMIGLAVMALTVYTATLARRAEYGVLKAIGARNADLYRAVLAQAFISVALGFAVGFAFTLILSALVPRLGLPLELQVSGESLAKVASASFVIAALSAVLPIRQIAGLDPAMVFRGR
jgi:putative ABC transport system permease protein